MDIISSIDMVDLFYAGLSAFVTVGLIILMRMFGKLPLSLFGPDLNLLTYGFLWDTSIKAIRGIDYWPNFDPSVWPINKGTTLLVVALVNLILLAWNFKLSHKVAATYQKSGRSAYTEWILKPFVIALGMTSLILFLLLQSMWG